MGEPMEWKIVTDMLASVLPTLGRRHGTLRLSYDLYRDQWIVVNDAGYTIRRQQAVGAIRDALAPFDDEGDEHA